MSELGFPLAGLKVLDFSRVLAGPFAGRLLCDLGADVVKVEPPDGDVTRLWGREIGNLPGYYHQQNVGKRNISLDLRAEGAQDLVLALVREADILIENYRPDVMPRLGLGYATLRAANPRLIMLSISGFGHAGPESHRPAYAPIVHAEAGLLARQARRADIRPSELPLSVADTNASLHGLVGVLAAVIHRASTGVGQHIDISMIDATVCTDDQLHYDLEDSEETGPLPARTWSAGCGEILISADFRYLWALLREHVGIEDPATKDTPLDEKIAARHAAVNRYLGSLTTWPEVEALMSQLNLAWGQVRDPADLPQQPTLAHRRAFAEVDDRAGGKRLVPQSPYRFSAATSGVRGPAPHRGEHNEPVLREWLNATDEDLSRWQSAGLVLDE